MVRILIEVGPEGFQMQGVPEDAFLAIGIFESAKQMVLNKTFGHSSVEKRPSLVMPTQPIPNLAKAFEG